MLNWKETSHFRDNFTEYKNKYFQVVGINTLQSMPYFHCCQSHHRFDKKDIYKKNSIV